MKPHRPLFEIAMEIAHDWKPVNPHALPYLDAMFALNQVTENYYEDSGKSIVLYFLSNAQTWKGEVARRIKSELKEIVK